LWKKHVCIKKTTIVYKKFIKHMKRICFSMNVDKCNL
jgi:hypothetical protein